MNLSNTNTIAHKIYDKYDLGHYNPEEFEKKYGTDQLDELIKDDIVGVIDTSRLLLIIYNYVFKDGSVITESYDMTPGYNYTFFTIKKLSDLKTK